MNGCQNAGENRAFLQYGLAVHILCRDIPRYQKQQFVHVLLNTHFFDKNIVYKNIQAQIGQKIKNILRISSASVLAIVFCFLLFFFKDFLD